MISQVNKQIISSLLILANEQIHYRCVTSLLSHYFTLVDQEYLYINNKYYKTYIKMVHEPWPQLQELQSHKFSHSRKAFDIKYDLLIIVVHEEESYKAEMYDYVISKYSPENFILIYHTKDKEKEWQDQEVISNQVNNFIEIIKEDLEMASKDPPDRAKKGLLQDNYEDGHIFNLVQLIQTTPWSSIQRKVGQKVIKSNSTQNKPSIPNVEAVISHSKSAEMKNEQKTINNEEIVDEEAMEKQMMVFENLISEMKNMKTLSKETQVSDVERKKKAESLISKLLGGGAFQ